MTLLRSVNHPNRWTVAGQDRGQWHTKTEFDESGQVYFSRE